MERAGCPQVNVGVTAAEDLLAALMQRRVNQALKRGDRTERSSQGACRRGGINSHWSAVTAIVPSAPIEIAGSLPPSGRSNGVLEKLRLPRVVTALIEADNVRVSNKKPRMNRSLVSITLLLSSTSLRHSVTASFILPLSKSWYE
jgi:hypothetical protein